MSLIICSKHGESGYCVRFSKNIVDAVKADIILNDNDMAIFTIHIMDDEDGELLYSERYLLRTDEFLKMETPSEISVDTEAQYDACHALLPDLDGLCAGCFQDYKEKHGVSMLQFR